MRRIHALWLAILLVASTPLVHHSFASGVDPGSMQDPLVTKSYVDQKIAEISGVVEVPATEPAPAVEIPTFVVVQAKAGQQVLCEESTELILRAGKAAAIGNSGGDGLSNVTLGADLKDGQDVPMNHLLIIPRTDGRGIKVLQDNTFVMVRGSYSIR
ncbi:hypothetical protein [Anaerotalea alkaliphila]|uniref:Uncharacterized protein n=1 Tax=Anaerotalea alkaliphila TaxID=2662126 RepID=A0A7X5HVY6_9FIRM|nr:hypothetical protein [Anaerotalea alkaliphila]NDL67658.1 hypothetical protein [Anaerotalea alkaliphila]